MRQAVLFVCMGNICRSPLAEGILRAKAAEAGIELTVDSAGTNGWHAGEPPDPRAIVAARTHGYDIENQQARKFHRDDFSAFSLILVMDNATLDEIEGMRPMANLTPVQMVTDYRPEPGPREVLDPYYTSRFDPVIETLEVSIQGLLDQMVAAQ